MPHEIKPAEILKSTAHFRYLHGLEKLLNRKFTSLSAVYQFTGHPSIKDAIEAMGVPHTEVDYIIVNGDPVVFSYKIQHKDIIEVYPPGVSPTAKNIKHLIPPLNAPKKFVLDVHLGKLARRMRLLGFDTCYANHFDDARIISIGLQENRIILTRDRGLLKHRVIVHGYLVRSNQVESQLHEVLMRYKLKGQISLWSRCINCNGKIKSVEKVTILKHLEPKTRLFFKEFHQCSSCQKIYWQGSHYYKMLDWLSRFFENSV